MGCVIMCSIQDDIEHGPIWKCQILKSWPILEYAWVLKTENYSKHGMFDEILRPILNYNLYSWNVYPLKKIVNW